jgi:hypothetical protein
VPDQLVPSYRGSARTPMARTGDAVQQARQVSAGRESLRYSQPEQVRWAHWPDEVLSALRVAGLAPDRLDIGTAGRPLTKRRPAGTYYRERVGWYRGRDLRGREVFVRIRATQPLRRLEVAGRRLALDGPWSTRAEGWLLGSLKTLTWPRRGGPSEGTLGTPPLEHISLNMPQDFVQCLRGMPEDIQQAVLEAIDFVHQPWGDAKAWGYAPCPANCHHEGPCEDVVLAAMDSSYLVVMEARRFRAQWQAAVTRAIYAALDPPSGDALRVRRQPDEIDHQ